MQAGLVVAGLVALLWGIWKLREPWREYHEVHISPLEKKVALAKIRRAEKERARSQAVANADLFTRDFRMEVRQHQKAKSDAYDDLTPLRVRKSELHEEMDDVRSGLDSWHRSSRSFFGNKGRKVKDDSILGWLGLEQTMAQKDSLEGRRDSISLEIRELKDEMSDIFDQRIRPAKDSLNAAFDDERRLKRLKQGGLSERQFRKKAQGLELEISKIDAKITRLKEAIREATEAYKKRRKA